MSSEVPPDEIASENIQRQILQLARQGCAENCKLAQVKARQGAAFMIRGMSSLEAVQSRYSEAVTDCPGPKKIEVCGAPEDEITYECRALGKLVALNFD